MTAPALGAGVAERRAAVIAGPLGGREACRALAAVTDEWLVEVFDRATEGRDRGLALVSVGGHGRGELAPGSDLDLWLLHEERMDAGAVAAVAERLWYPVWDSGLKLGHAVLSPRRALALASAELDTATAVLSARHLAGDPAVGLDLAERGRRQWRKRSGRWLDELGRRTASRHAGAGEVAFLLEPDVKEGRGGLRDVHVLGWAQVARPVLAEGDVAALAEAEEVLLAVRVGLHRATGRASDGLLLERQDEVAAALGEADADALMYRLAGAARTVTWISDEAWHRLSSSLAGPAGRVFRRDRPLGPDLVLRDGEVHLEASVDPAADGTLVLRAAAAAARAEVPLDRSSLDRLAASAPVLAGPWPDGALAALVDLLATGPAAVPVIEALDQRHLVERVLPEWASVRSKPQRNAYHRFTVDRHLCEAAAVAAGLCPEVPRPDLLLVGAWLHDLGKGFPGDHTDVGVELMAEVAPRMGFGPADAAVLCDLVRHHLLLPDVATRRDLSDDAVIEGVAEAVGSLTTLELLAALTEADSLATGPSAWGEWKAGLVAQLVERVAHVVRGGDAGEVTGGGFPGTGVRRLMAAGDTVVAGEGDVLTVVAPDRPGLFARVAGALALEGLGVLAADAASGEHGMAASQFQVEPGGDGVDWDRVASRVGLAVEGRLALAARMAARSRTYRRQAPGTSLLAAPRVHVDNHASASSTVVEVRAPDAVGVLYRITTALAELDLDIRLARVATLGSEVVDTFYVRTAAGGKLTEREHLRELERAVLHHLER